MSKGSSQKITRTRAVFADFKILSADADLVIQHLERLADTELKKLKKKDLIPVFKAAIKARCECQDILYYLLISRAVKVVVKILQE